MVLKTIPWALTDGGAAANPAERIRQAMQASLSASGVVNAGDLQVSALGTPNMSVNVAPGSIWIPGTQGSTAGEGTNFGAQTAYGTPAFPSTFTSQGCYFDYNDAVVNLVIGPANATNPRIDLIVATVQDADYTAGPNQAILQVIAGTPGGTPVPPTGSVPPNSVVLAQVLVGASVTSINAGNITDLRPYGALGATRPPLTSASVQAPQTIPGSGVFTQLGLDTVGANTANQWYGLNDGVFTCTYPGWYEINAILVFAGNATGRRLARVDHNGIPGGAIQQTELSSVGTVGANLVLPTSYVFLNVGDTIDLLGYQNSGTALSVVGSMMTSLWVSR